MERESRKEQHYAVSEAGLLVDISKAHKDSLECFCPHCGCRMLKKCGDIRAWHFAHDWRLTNDMQKNCSYETYLHGYAKLRLKQWFDESNSIILHYEQSNLCKSWRECNLIRTAGCSVCVCKSCDLKELFSHCTIESSIEGSNGIYRADLLLSSDKHPNHDRQVLIEIKVTHGCSEKKKKSDVPIIEFDVTSEEDVDYIITHDIMETEKVRFYGFKNLIKKDCAGKIKPIKTFQKFILYKSRKTFCKEINCQTLTDRHRNALIELTAEGIQRDQYWLLNLYGLMKVREYGYQIPSCYLCEHYNYNGENEAQECEVKKTAIGKGHDALNCESYIFKSGAFDRIKALSYSFKIIDVWNSCGDSK